MVIPIMMLRQFPIFQKVRKIVEDPQHQHVDRVLDFTVVLQFQVQNGKTVRRIVEAV